MVHQVGTPIEGLSHVNDIGLGELMEALDSLLQQLIAFLCIFNSVDCLVDAVDLIEMVTLSVVYCCTIFAEEENLFEQIVQGFGQEGPEVDHQGLNVFICFKQEDKIASGDGLQGHDSNAPKVIVRTSEVG